MQEVEKVERKLEKLFQLKKELAVYFCEDESGFKLEDMLGVFRTFCGHLKKAIEVCTVIVQ